MNKLIKFYQHFSTEINTLVSIIVSIIVVPYFTKKRKVKDSKTNKKKQLDSNFQDNLGDIYIPMNVSEVQPDNQKKTIPFFKHFVEIIQKRPIKSRYICLLGDIGSGKTAALAHLHQWYIDEYSDKPSMPSNIKLYTLNIGYQKLMNRINVGTPNEDRGNCILLLDALDECEEARASLENTQENNPRKFMEKLGKDTQGFAWVVVSCRRQFFQSKEFLPGKAKAPGGKKSFRSVPYWQELILEPFNQEQVESFLDLHFGVGENPRKDEAANMVYNCEDVFLRPLILSNIDIILEDCRGQKNLTMKVILDAVILNWIIGEANGDEAKAKELLKASLCTAAYMYKHKLNYLKEADYKAMCKEHGIDDHENLLRMQSLLTNDETEGFRFAHQSFYEHLMAYWFFLNPDDIGSLLGLLESTLPAYIEILNEDKDNATEMSRLLGQENVNDETKALGLYNMGIELKNLNHFTEAESFYKLALDNYRNLEKNHPEEYIYDTARVLNNLGEMHRIMNHHDKAEVEYKEALVKYKKLTKEKNDDYRQEVAMTLNNLGIMHRADKHYDKAEIYLQNALKLFKKLAMNNSDNNLSFVAMVLSNIANLHQNTELYDKAEEEYKEALDKYRELAEMESVALALNNLATLHYNVKQNDKAEDEYNEALKIYRELTKNNPDAFLPSLAMTLNNIAELHRDTCRHKKAKKEYSEALNAFQDLAEHNPDAYLFYVAITMDNLANLHKEIGEWAEAEKKAKDCIDLYQRMSKINPDAFDEYLEMAKQLLSDIQSKKMA